MVAVFELARDMSLDRILLLVGWGSFIGFTYLDVSNVELYVAYTCTFTLLSAFVFATSKRLSSAVVTFLNGLSSSPAIPAVAGIATPLFLNVMAALAMSFAKYAIVPPSPLCNVSAMCQGWIKLSGFEKLRSGQFVDYGTRVPLWSDILPNKYRGIGNLDFEDAEIVLKFQSPSVAWGALTDGLQHLHANRFSVCLLGNDCLSPNSATVPAQIEVRFLKTFASQPDGGLYDVWILVQDKNYNSNVFKAFFSTNRSDLL